MGLGKLNAVAQMHLQNKAKAAKGQPTDDPRDEVREELEEEAAKNGGKNPTGDASILIKKSAKKKAAQGQ